MNGIIRLYKLVNGVKTVIANVGTIDYMNGIINIVQLNVIATDIGLIEFRCHSTSNDIVCLNNTALIVNSADISINVISESNATNHIFTSSF